MVNQSLDSSVANDRFRLAAALTAAGHALAATRGKKILDEVDQRMFEQDAETVVMAYLKALRK